VNLLAQTHGYTESQASGNDGCSISSFGAANSSVTSLQSLLVMPGSSSDCGVRATTQLFGFTYELLSYAIGESSLLSPPLPIADLFGGQQVNASSLNVALALDEPLPSPLHSSTNSSATPPPSSM
jgi:hypothetical protein